MHRQGGCVGGWVTHDIIEATTSSITASRRLSLVEVSILVRSYFIRRLRPPYMSAWSHLASRHLPRDLCALGWHIFRMALYSSIFLARVSLCAALPWLGLWLACPRQCTSSSPAPTLRPCPIGLCGRGSPSLRRRISAPHDRWRFCSRTTTAPDSRRARNSTENCGPFYGYVGSRRSGVSSVSTPMLPSGSPSPLLSSSMQRPLPSSGACGWTTCGLSVMCAPWRHLQARHCFCFGAPRSRPRGRLVSHEVSREVHRWAGHGSALSSLSPSNPSGRASHPTPAYKSVSAPLALRSTFFLLLK